jgi:hypothetical protein
VLRIHEFALRLRFKRHYGVPPSIELSTGGTGLGTGFGGM